MDFLAIIISLLILKQLGTAAPFQYDAWFHQWVGVCRSVQRIPLVFLLLCLFAPIIFVAFIDLNFGHWLWGLIELVLTVLILLFSIGRGSYKTTVREYIELWRTQRANHFTLDEIESKLLNREYTHPTGDDDIQAGAKSLYAQHYKLRETIIYSGFQRVFVVLFWFAILGPVGALFYRLANILQHSLVLEDDNQEAEPSVIALNQTCLSYLAMVIRCLEWPASRLLGLSYALMGDFAKVLPMWVSTLSNFSLPLAAYVHKGAVSALQITSQWESEDFVLSRSEDALAKMAADETQKVLDLYQRTLILALLGISIAELLL